MDGVTGRLGQTQHLIRSLLAIRSEGGALSPLSAKAEYGLMPRSMAAPINFPDFSSSVA